MKSIVVTKDDVRLAVDDTLNILDILITRIDGRFRENEQRIIKLQKDVKFVSCQLDGVHKKLELSDDERLVMAYQLSCIHRWVEDAGERIGIKFTRHP